MDKDKAIRSAKLTLGGMLEKKRAKTAVERAQGQIAPSKYLPDVPRQAHATGGYVPQATLPVPKLAVARPLATGQQQQPGLIDTLGSLASLGNKAADFKKLVSPQPETSEPDRNSSNAPASAPAAGNRNADTGNMSAAALAAHNALMEAYGQPLPVLSAYRDPEQNKAADGAKNSQHMYGNAYDYDVSGMTTEERIALADMAWNAGYRGVGFYDNSMHFDVGDPRAWGPSYHRDSIPDWAQEWASSRYGYASGGSVDDDQQPSNVADLGQAREQKQLQTYHTGMMGDISDAMSERMEAHQKAIDAGVFDGYEMGDVLQGSAHPMRITGRFIRPWKPSRTVLQHFDRMGAKPTIIEHNGKQYIPMLRYQTGVEGQDGWQEGDAYLDGVKAAGYRKMGVLRAVKADGGSVTERSPMFEGMSEHLMDDEGKPMELWHGTPHNGDFEHFDDEKLGSRDAGFYGRGHYLTPDRDVADEYTISDDGNPGEGQIVGPLHAALKNPYVWDVSSDQKSHSTLRDLQGMGIMRDRSELRSWDNLQRHEINRFMDHMKQRGHDGVIYKTHRGAQEIVVFNPNMIKHRDAEVGDPSDPRIMRNTGGKVDLYSKAAAIIRKLKDQPMDVADIINYAKNNGAKPAEIAHSDIPPGKARPLQVAEHIEFMQPKIGVNVRGRQYRFGNDQSYANAIQAAERAGNHDLAEELNQEWEHFAGQGGGGTDQPRYAQYQLPGGKNYREHVLTLDNHPDDQTYMARNHWGRLRNPLAHIRMSDRVIGNKKILHVEEMQSDWNNDARRHGFRTGTERKDYEDFVRKMREDAKSMIDATPMVRTALEKKYDEMDPYMLALKLGRQSEHNQMARAANENTMAPPRAPYINPKKDDWAELAMKHVLTEAAKGGYDGISFTPDEAQSERWGGTDFNGIYNKKLPGMASRLIQQHDNAAGGTDDPQIIAGWGAPHVELTDKARDSILKNGFSSFRRGGYVTHVRR